MSATSQLSPPLTLPASPAELSATVTRLWEGAGGVASLARVDAGRVLVVVGRDGALTWRLAHPGPAQRNEPEGPARALSSLADALRDLGYVVTEVGGVRVLGWAAVPQVTCVRFRPDDGFPICDGFMVGPDDGKAGLYPTRERAIEAHGAAPMPLVRIVDLDITDRRRSDHFAAVLERRLSRLSQDGPGVDVKRAHGVAQAEAHARSWVEDVRRKT